MCQLIFGRDVRCGNKPDVVFIYEVHSMNKVNFLSEAN